MKTGWWVRYRMAGPMSFQALKGPFDTRDLAVMFVNNKKNNILSPEIFHVDQVLEPTWVVKEEDDATT